VAVFLLALLVIIPIYLLSANVPEEIDKMKSTDQAPVIKKNSQGTSITGQDALLPAPTSPVMDYTGILDANTKRVMETRLLEFQDRTNPKVELAVAIVKTTGERPIFDYSFEVARSWNIGSKESGKGALLFIAVEDKKYFTQVSRSLQDVLPDELVGQLQQQYLVPAMRQGNYGKAILDTLESYIRAIEAKQR
jgi:uncharacterized protein